MVALWGALAREPAEKGRASIGVFAGHVFEQLG